MNASPDPPEKAVEQTTPHPFALKDNRSCSTPVDINDAGVRTGNDLVRAH
jgi:hypothetical protein